MLWLYSELAEFVCVSISLPEADNMKSVTREESIVLNTLLINRSKRSAGM